MFEFTMKAFHDQYFLVYATRFTALIFCITL